MNLKTKFVLFSLIGLVLGMFVGIVSWMLPHTDDSNRSILLHIVMSGLHGMIPLGATAVYDIESWGITKSTVVHAALTLATIICIEIPMKWWNSLPQFLLAVLIYSVIYAIIWACNYFYWKHTVKQMNEQLQTFNHQ